MVTEDEILPNVFFSDVNSMNDVPESELELNSHKNTSNGLLFNNVLEDVNKCAINIMQKHNLTSEVKMIKRILSNTTFIEIMDGGTKA